MRAAAELVTIMEVNPPVRHSPWLWLVGAACLLLAVASGIAWPRLTGRRERAEALRRDTGLERLRAEALAQIAQVESGHRAGEVSDREVHQELSAIVRRFVGTVTDGDADFQTLGELREAAERLPRLAPLVEFVASGYLPSFAPEETAPVDSALADARELVTSWA